MYTACSSLRNFALSADTVRLIFFPIFTRTKSSPLQVLSLFCFCVFDEAFHGHATKHKRVFPLFLLMVNQLHIYSHFYFSKATLRLICLFIVPTCFLPPYVKIPLCWRRYGPSRCSKHLSQQLNKVNIWWMTGCQKLQIETSIKNIWRVINQSIC